MADFTGHTRIRRKHRAKAGTIEEEGLVALKRLCFSVCPMCAEHGLSGLEVRFIYSSGQRTIDHRYILSTYTAGVIPEVSP